ncbi:hypothetical protein ACLMJK_007059 [Lecanora helva]
MHAGEENLASTTPISTPTNLAPTAVAALSPRANVTSTGPTQSRVPRTARNVGDWGNAFQLISAQDQEAASLDAEKRKRDQGLGLEPSMLDIQETWKQRGEQVKTHTSWSPCNIFLREPSAASISRIGLPHGELD